MKQIDVLPSLLPPDTGGIVSWVQIGDLHLTTAAEQNFADLRHIAEQLNARFAANRGILGTQLGPNRNGRKW